MRKKNLTLIIAVMIISLAIIIGAIIISNPKEEQRLEYYCKISQEKLNNIVCTSTSDCPSSMICDLSLWKCINAPGSGSTENINQQDCDKIGGDWELRLAE